MPRPISLSLPVEAPIVATLRSVAGAMRSLGLRYVVVGATARDMGANEAGRKAADALMLEAFLKGFRAEVPTDE